MAYATTLSSLGTSIPIILNPVPKSTTVQITVASGSSGNFLTQYTLDDPSNAATTSITWAALSSAIISSNADGFGVTYTMLSPIGGLRLSSTATAVTGAITLKALQSITA